MDKIKILPKIKLDNLPKTSGVYLFYGENLNPKPYTLSPIYIGKAINIKGRVKNHFSQPSYRDNLFINEINRIGYIETNSEIEALVLEAKLIKKYLPKFNVIWKDDKNYFYVAIETNSKGLPFVYITHQPKSSSKTQNPTPNTQFIGPFVEGRALKKTLQFLRRPFPYYSSKIHSKSKCMYCHLGLCPGSNPDIQNYKKNIKKLSLTLKGEKTKVLGNLKSEMKKLSKNSEFEKAGLIRDQIQALERILEHTHVIEPKTSFIKSDPFVLLQKILNLKNPIIKIECYDVSNIQGKQATGSMVVFTEGNPDKSQYKKFKIYPIKYRLPQLNNFTKSKIKPKAYLTGRAVISHKEKLFDRVKMEKPNDTGMLKQVLKRRFSHPEWKYPEVILIDGGIAQLNAAIEVRDTFQKTKNIYPIKSAEGGAPPKAGQFDRVKVISIAKRLKELFIEGREKPILLKSLPQDIYNLIIRLDDEAHRFALTYHKKLRKKNLFK